MREGRFYPGHGLERIVAYHERQDARFAEAAAELSRRYGKPILTATELAVADPDNPGPASGAGHRPALLPERQPRRHAPSATCTATPGTANAAACDCATLTSCRRCRCSRSARVLLPGGGAARCTCSSRATGHWCATAWRPTSTSSGGADRPRAARSAAATSAAMSAPWRGWCRSPRSTTAATRSSPSARGGSGSTRGCPTTRTRAPTSRTGPTTSPTIGDEDLAELYRRVAAKVRRIAALAIELGDVGRRRRRRSSATTRSSAATNSPSSPRCRTADQYDLLCAPGPATAGAARRRARRRRGRAASSACRVAELGRPVAADVLSHDARVCRRRRRGGAATRRACPLHRPAQQKAERPDASQGVGVGWVIHLVKDYARQETLGPLRAPAGGSRSARRRHPARLRHGRCSCSACSACCRPTPRHVRRQWMSLLPYVIALVVAGRRHRRRGQPDRKKSLHKEST